MPIAADPDKLCEYWLESDKDKPEATRPVFLCRFMTQRQLDRAVEFLQTAIKIGNGPDAWKAVRDAIQVGVVGWRNMRRADDGTDPGEFSMDKLTEVLTNQEIRELAGLTERDGYLTRVQLAEGDLKNSGSPQPGTVAQSANPAGAEPAETSQANPPS